MDSFNILMVWLFSLVFGGVIASGLAQVVSGRMLMPLTHPPWSAAEVKLSGWSWVLTGLAGAVWTLVGGLALGARVISVGWVQSPATSAVFSLVIIGNGFFQLMIDRHHKQRWPF